MASYTDQQQKLKDNWEKIKETVKTEYNVSNIAFHTWISPLSFYSEENDTITALITGNNADNSLALEYINNKYKNFFQVTISEFMNHEYDIRFLLEKDIQSEDKESLPNHAEKGNIYNIKYIISNLTSSVISVFIRDHADFRLNNAKKKLFICKNRFQFFNFCH